MNNKVYNKIEERKIVSICRGIGVESILPAVEAVYRGGISVFEITFDQTDKETWEKTAESIKLIKKYGPSDIVVGAGTVMNKEQLELAVEAGAEFVLAPNVNIEVIKEAVDASNELAKINDLSDKIENYNGLCEEILPTVCNNLEKEEKDFSIVLDPPRKGCHINVLNAILKVKPKKVVYVSCSPQTLARDLGILLGTLGYDEKGELKRTQSNNGIYQIESITPYDMFPQTKHVETLVCLGRK